MKKITLTALSICLFCICMLAQSVPQGMNYQAVARDADGNVLADTPISIEISLLTNVEKGGLAYSEIHKVITNQFGFFNLTIGQGKTSIGSFDNVPWDEHEIWMEIGMDETGGKDFRVINTTKLLTVPYAFHAGTANKIGGENRPGNDDRVPWWGQPWWNIEGLEKTNPDKHFIGNIDSVDLVFRTNDLERLRIQADGRIVMPGDVEIGGTLQVKGDSTIVRSLYAQGLEVVIDSFLTVGQNASFGDNINVANNITAGGNGTFQNITAQQNGTIGDVLTVNGPTILNSTLSVGDSSRLNGQVTIHADITGGGEADYSQYPLRVEGGDHGVAIKVNNSGDFQNRTKNWMTFYNGSEEPMGRIEGFRGFSEFGQAVIDDIFDGMVAQSLGLDNPDVEQTLPDPDQLDNTGDYFNNDYAIGSLSESLDVASAIFSFVTNTYACYVGAGLAGDCDDALWSGVDAFVQIIQLAGYITYNELNVGAAFESGGADYAEWLQKANIEEAINFGEVVGVKGGTVSKSFVDADQFMVVSNNPTIIGAMPEAGHEKAFEKIAFMGQVPVKVIGEVELGDFILPSGNGDGMAMAVNKKDMKAKDFSRIIGVAWSVSDGKELFQYINVAVGLNTNDMADMIENMQLLMNQMQNALAEVNPNFDPVYYDVEGQVRKTQLSYSISEPMKEVLAQRIGISDQMSKEEAFAAVGQYAETMNIDLSRYPYLGEILENPNDVELLIKAQNHYLKVTEDLSALMESARN